MLLSAIKRFKFKHIGLITKRDIRFLKENMRIIADCDMRFIEKYNKKHMERNNEKMARNNRDLSKELLGFNISTAGKIMLLGLGLFGVSLIPLIVGEHYWEKILGLGCTLLSMGVMDCAISYREIDDQKKRVSIPAHPIAKIKQIKNEKERQKIERVKEMIDVEKTVFHRGLLER